MKILPFRIPKPEKNAFVYQEDHERIFYNKLHQHEEIQISFIARGEGKLIVGDTVSHYKKGNVIVIGSNLPHVFNSEPKHNETSLMLSLFFTFEAFGGNFFELEELKALDPFFKKATYGFKVIPEEDAISELFYKLKACTSLEKFICLLEILMLLSKEKHHMLSSFIYKKRYTDNEGKRMQNVMEYTTNNYHKEISLNTIADIAAMTKTAFCKYFKKRTNKTYVQFLNELRIEHASKLLLAKEDFTIAEIGHLSGFNNISNFNRQFKTIKGISPSQLKIN